MPSIQGRVQDLPTLIVPRDPEAKAKTHRAAQSFGVRELQPSELQKYDLEIQRKILKEQRSAPVVKVRVSKNDTIRQGLLPLYKGAYGGNEPLGRKSIGRFLQRIFAWFPWNRRTSGKSVKLSVLGPYAQTLREARNPQQPVNNGWGNTDMQARSPQKTVQASDQDLARLIGYEGKSKFNQAYAVPDSKPGTNKDGGDPLFGSKGPQLSDIQQADNRQTCHFLANLAAILARPDGAQRIQNIMKDNGDGTVTVRFADMDVRVSKDRLVNWDGDDLLNVGAPWVRVMEKAFLAYFAHKFGNTTDLSTVDSKAFRDKDKQNPNFMYRFDFNQPSIAQMALGHTLAEDASECATIDEREKTTVDFTQNGFRSKKTGLLQRKPDTQGLTPDEIYERVDSTLNEGGSVFAGVTSSSKWFRRMLSGHIYSIVATGERTKLDSTGKPELDSNGQPKVEKGFWVFDSYGASVDSSDIEKSKHKGTDVSVEGNDQQVVLKDGTRGRNSRFFVTKEQAAELFSDFNIAHRVRPRAPSSDSDINAPEPQSDRSVVVEPNPTGSTRPRPVGRSIDESNELDLDSFVEVGRDGRSNTVSSESLSEFEQIDEFNENLDGPSRRSSSLDGLLNGVGMEDPLEQPVSTPADAIRNKFSTNEKELKSFITTTFSKASSLKVKPENIEFSLNGFKQLVCTVRGLPGVEDVKITFGDYGNVELDLAQLSDETQGQGLAKGFFATILRLSERSPEAVKSMSMLANISVGGYAWARCGFVPSRRTAVRIYRQTLDKLDAYLEFSPNDKQVRQLRDELEHESNNFPPNPRLIRKIAALTQPVENQGDLALSSKGPKTVKGQYTLGKACLLGTRWDGSFDLKKDRQYLESYIGMSNAPRFNPFGKNRSDYRKEYAQITWGRNDNKA